MKKINVSLVIPTYNDEASIERQLKTCEQILRSRCSKYEIIVADDRSRDKTWNLLQKKFSKKKHFKVFQNKNNIGITKNVRQLYLLARYEFVLFYSADGDWNPKDVGNLINTQIKENADIVIGKRIKKIGYTFYRQFISSMHRFLPLIFFGVDTKDPGGIKLIRRKLIHVHLVSESQFFEAEIIIRAKLNGHKLAYFPVVYKKPKTGAGYGGDFKSAIESFIDVLRVRISLPPKF